VLVHDLGYDIADVERCFARGVVIFWLTPNVEVVNTAGIVCALNSWWVAAQPALPSGDGSGRRESRASAILRLVAPQLKAKAALEHEGDQS
jgi:hypothetical protein